MLFFSAMRFVGIARLKQDINGATGEVYLGQAATKDADQVGVGEWSEDPSGSGSAHLRRTRRPAEFRGVLLRVGMDYVSWTA